MFKIQFSADIFFFFFSSSKRTENKMQTKSKNRKCDVCIVIQIDKTFHLTLLVSWLTFSQKALHKTNVF